MIRSPFAHAAHVEIGEMTSTTTWNPKTIEERLDRLESLDEIRQLPHRYALAVDTRNLDDLVALFIEDVQIGRDKFGREALREQFLPGLARIGDSVHFVGNHVIDFESAHEARGVVTCRDEIEYGGEWRVGMIQYWDTYSRRNGRWYFKRRRLHRWYLVDALTRPHHGAGLETETGAAAPLPESWPSWARFWNERGRPPR
jgi:hypothetical protein